jgi:hypothetical protein
MKSTSASSATTFSDFDINSDVDVLLASIDKCLLKEALDIARREIAINPGALTKSHPEPPST